jgi:hypothetical protein
MIWKLFIDDERVPVDDGWVIARTSADAIAEITGRGWPSYISFDHDLGGDDTAMAVVNWMLEQVLDGTYQGTIPEFYVHSQNPIGRDKLRARMSDLVKAKNIMLDKIGP